MDESTTTAGADSQVADTSATTDTSTTDTQETQTATDSQTATDTSSDNLDTSKSTDDQADDGDKSTDEGDGKGTEGADDASASPKFDKDIDSWAEKTGRPVPTNDTERALLQEIRDDQRKYSRAQQAKDVNKDIDAAIDDVKPDVDVDEDGDPLENDVKSMKQQLAEEKSTRLRSEFMYEHNVTVDQAKVMGEILKEKVEKGGANAHAYWTHPDQLQDWLDLANARLSKSTDDTQLRDEVARKERERIAKEQQATSPGRGAKATVTTDNTPEAQRLKTFSNWD